MIIIGKSSAAISMICDALKGSDIEELFIYNNLGIEGKIKYAGHHIKETKILEDEFYYMGAVMPNTKKQLMKLFPFEYISLTNRTAYVSPDARIGQGTMIDANASILSGAIIGHMNTIYTSVISHGCITNDYVTVCPGAILCGSVHVGEGTMIGAGSVIKNGIKIGSNCVIGCGAVVVKNVANNKVMVGNPAKELIR
jgi:acetyltransferase-like isoleucine patch superfamily enzyme